MIEASDLLNQAIEIISEHLKELQDQVSKHQFDPGISNHISRYAATLIDIKEHQQKEKDIVTKSLSKMSDAEIIDELKKNLHELENK